MDIKVLNNDTTQVDNDDVVIKETLQYVKQEQIRILSATYYNNNLSTRVRFFAPNYTVNPVTYLSSSEVAISTAQAGQVMLDYMMADLNCPLSTWIDWPRLRKARMEHRVYFTDFHVRFRAKLPPYDYNLFLTSQGVRRARNILFSKFDFVIEESKVLGNFIGVIPIERKSYGSV